MVKSPKIVAKNILAKTDMMSIEQVDLTFSNGQRRQYQRIDWHSKGAVMIVPMLDAQTMLLIREYAVGFERYTLGFPKGALALGESPRDTAMRELKEEIGYGARKLNPLFEFGDSPSYSTMNIHLFLADDLYPEKLEGDEPEPLELVPWQLSEIDSLLAHPDFIDMRSISALLLLARKLHV